MSLSAPSRSENQWWKLTKISILVFLSLLTLLILAAAVIWISYRSDLPSLDQLESYEPSLITRIYSDDGAVLKEISMKVAEIYRSGDHLQGAERTVVIVEALKIYEASWA